MGPGISGKARAKDGCLLFYRMHPQPGKPRLVLVHSLALDAGIWDGVVGELDGESEILVYDCRGHGQSDRRPGPYTAQLFANDLAALLDHCRWPSAVIAGCSMGGCVAQAFAAEFAERVRALTLVDTTAWYGPTAPEDWRKRAATAAEQGFQAMLSFQLSRWFGDDFRSAHADVADRLSAVFLANDVACYRDSCALLGNADLRDAISSFRIPVSVIVGEQDYATPLAMAQAMQGLIPASTLTVIAGARHLTPVERPKEIAGLFKDLLRRTTRKMET
jgi:3-oxoadipate enol-lactonase